MNNCVLLEHKVYSDNSLNTHYDFLVENGIDCLTWKFFKLPLLNQASKEMYDLNKIKTYKSLFTFYLSTLICKKVLLSYY